MIRPKAHMEKGRDRLRGPCWRNGVTLSKNKIGQDTGSKVPRSRLQGMYGGS